MTFKRRNGGRKHGCGHVKFIRCSNCGKCCPKVFKHYFEELEEEPLRHNFVVVYELLDEMMDFGYPQYTEAKILSEFIKTDAYRMEVTQRPPMAVTNAVSWRSDGINYKKNEVFLDVVESVNILVNTNGQIIRSDVVGALKMRTYLRTVYHCPYCNLCRLGRGLGVDFFHSLKCDCCLSLKLIIPSCLFCLEKSLEFIRSTVVAITVFCLLVVAFYAFFAPFLGGQIWVYALFGTYSLVALLVFILYVRSTAINPADPRIMSKFDFGNKPNSKLELSTNSRKFNELGTATHSSPSSTRSSMTGVNSVRKGSEEQTRIDMQMEPPSGRSSYHIVGGILYAAFVHEDCRKQDEAADQQGTGA